jgi:hypothetical protein
VGRLYCTVPGFERGVEASDRLSLFAYFGPHSVCSPQSRPICNYALFARFKNSPLKMEGQNLPKRRYVTTFLHGDIIWNTVICTITAAKISDFTKQVWFLKYVWQT